MLHRVHLSEIALCWGRWWMRWCCKCSAEEVLQLSNCQNVLPVLVLKFGHFSTFQYCILVICSAPKVTPKSSEGDSMSVIYFLAHCSTIRVCLVFLAVWTVCSQHRQKYLNSNFWAKAVKNYLNNSQSHLWSVNRTSVNFTFIYYKDTRSQRLPKLNSGRVNVGNWLPEKRLK